MADLTNIVISMTDIFNWEFLVAITFFVFLILYFKTSKKQAIFFVVVMGLASLVVYGSKILIQRPRPFGQLIQLSSYAFPSGHATMSTVFLGLLTYILIREGKLSGRGNYLMIFVSVILAAIISISRVYLNVHYLTDVLGGIVIGGLIVVVSVLAGKKRGVFIYLYT